MTDDLFCRQVRRKGKNLEDCIAQIAIWSMINARRLPERITKAMEKAAKEHPEEMKKAGIL